MEFLFQVAARRDSILLSHLTGFAVLLALTVGYLIWFTMYRRRKLRELDLLAEFQRSVNEDDIA